MVTAIPIHYVDTCKITVCGCYVVREPPWRSWRYSPTGGAWPVDSVRPVSRPMAMSEPKTPPQSDRLNDLLSLLADSERRAIITHLQYAASDTTSLETLVTVLAGDSPIARDSARIRLYHTHLPKLAQTPLLSYDQANGSVQYLDHPELESLGKSVHVFEAADDGFEPEQS